MKKLFISLFAALFALGSFAAFASPVKMAPTGVIYADDDKKDEAKEEQKADDDKKEESEKKSD